MAVLATVLLLGLTAFTAAAAAAVGAAAITTLSGFVVASDGRLYRIVPSAGSSGPGMIRLTDAVVAPPGAAISGVRQPDGTLALFFIGNHGGLVAATTSVTGAQLTTFNVTPGTLAPAGGKVSATVAANTVHVFFPGNNGAIYAVSFGQRVGPQPVPWLTAVTGPGTAPPSASIAAVWNAEPYVTLGALFIGVDGGLHAVWQQASGAWTTFAVGPRDVAPPGGGLAALSAQGLPAQGFYVGNDGTLWRIDAGPKPDPWRQPQAISAAGSAPPGAALTAVRFRPGPVPYQPTAVFFVAANGAVHVATNPETTWLAPAPATTPGAATPGGPITATLDPTGELAYVAWCGNDTWWWLRWHSLVPPPPPPPWYGERFSVTAPTIRPNFNPAAATWGT